MTTSSAAEYVPDQQSFDAFGKPRKGDFTTGTDRLHSSDYNVTTEHGFTGHEHLDETYLIHMNGRVYDYKLGRFLSVDPIISNPANSQSINPYSYIGNNPLSGVDPTGYVEEKIDLGKCADGEATGCTSRADMFHNEMGFSSSQVIGSFSTSTSAGKGGNGGDGLASQQANSNSANQGSPQHTAEGQADGRHRVLIAQAEPPEEEEPGENRSHDSTPKDPQEVLNKAVANEAKKRVEAAGGSTNEITVPGPTTRENAESWKKAAENLEDARTPTGGSEKAPPVSLDPRRIDHIFRDESGHIIDTPANRALLQKVANDRSAILGPDARGNIWSATVRPDGSQVWVQIRDGRIINGGINVQPRAYDPTTGLSGRMPP